MALSKLDGVKLLDDFRYTLPADVTMRLSKSIIFYKGLPVWVRNTDESLNVHLVLFDRPVPEGKLYPETTVHSSDVDLDVSSPTVGWVNNPIYGPCYIMRSARNAQKQGLSLHHCMAVWPKKDGPRTREGYGWDSYFDLQVVMNTIMNRFPRIEEVTKLPFGCAFDRDWALSNVKDDQPKYYTVFHKTVPVGTYFVKSKTFFFRRGRLTKTRRFSLEGIFSRNGSGGTYVIKEQI